MGWEQRLHLVRSSPDGSCLHLGLPESPVHPVTLQPLLWDRLHPRLLGQQELQAGKGCLWLLPTAQLQGQGLGSPCVQTFLGTWCSLNGLPADFMASNSL